MVDLTQAVHESVSAVCPITGVSIGTLGVRSTWKISFDPSATSQQRTAGQAALDAFDLNAYQTAQAAEASRVATFAADSGVADLLQRLQTATTSQIDTWLTNNVTTLAQARTVLAAIIKYLVARRLFN